MVIYPFNNPIILNDERFSLYGGLGTGSFSQAQLQSSYWLAEMQVSKYVGTLLLPHNVTGTMNYVGYNRLATDYGYVHQINDITVFSKKAGSTTCQLQANDGCAYIYEDTYGYIDFKQVASVCGCSYVGYPYGRYTYYNFPYQIQAAYQAGLPTGVATMPGILEALTIVAQIDLNSKFPGIVGQNEGNGDIAIQEFKALDYTEKRGEHSLVRTILGESPQAMRASRLIKATVKLARRVLLA